MSQDQAEYITQPEAIIDPPRTVKALRDGSIVDYSVWGWVKTSAKFRKHIRILRGAKHDIWHYLALGVDETGVCKETIKEICEGTGYSHTEVINTLKELDELGYLTIQKDKRGNSYIPEFVARGENKPTENVVKKVDSTPVDSTPVYQVESTPPIEPLHSIPLRVKRVKPTPNGDGVDFELQKLHATSIRQAFKKWPFNVNWETKSAREFMEWAVSENVTPEQIERAAETWRLDKAFNWQQPTLKLIFEKWPALNKPQEQPQENSTSMIRTING